MPRHTHPDDDMVYACPECDTAPVYRRVRKNVEFDADKEFACHACSTGFDEDDIVERPTKTGGRLPGAGIDISI